MNAGNAYSTYWAPVINLVRDPRWGRNIETPGEDPYLTGQYAANFVKGFQESPDDPTHVQASACCKHFVANSMENWYNYSRHNYDAMVSKADLADYYFPAFKACVMEGKVMSIMCSYNAGKMTTLPLSGFTCVSAHLRQCLSLTCTSNAASVNGVPMCANTEMLNGTLRNAWKFDGYVK